MEVLCRWYAEGKIDPLIMRHIPLEDASRGLEEIGSRATWGKLVVEI
jgi:NADPH:quinone reductase-like Zn-dependent oxidoreductase